MNLYTCTDHDGVQPTGVASIVVARNTEVARELLDAKLVQLGLKTYVEDSYKLDFFCRVVPGTRPQALILCDGDY